MVKYGTCKSSSGRRLKIIIPSTGTLYLIRDKKVWYMIPEALRKIIIKRIEDAFTFNGKKAMIVKRVNEGGLLQALNFADVVVRVYQNTTDGQKKIWDHYKKQESQIKAKHPNFKGINWTRPTGDYGNAMMDKRVVVEGKKQYLVCLTEGAVYVDFVKATTGGLLTKIDSVNYRKPLSQLPVAAQKKVAYGIGNSLAHEARHQLDLPQHAGAGIGMDANSMTNSLLYGSSSTFSASDQSRIKDQIKQLHLMQCNGKTVFITR